MRLLRDALKMDAWVGFRATAPGFLGPEVAWDMSDCLPGSGMSDCRLELVSDTVGDAGVASAGFVAANAASSTSLRNAFFVDISNVMCSSGTVSRFFSRKPSTS